MNGLLLNSVIWNDYTTFLAAQASDTAGASLSVPDDTGMGQKQGEIVFWAEVKA